MYLDLFSFNVSIFYGNADMIRVSGVAIFAVTPNSCISKNKESRNNAYFFFFFDFISIMIKTRDTLDRRRLTQSCASALTH